MTGEPQARRNTAAGVMFSFLAAGVGGAWPVYVGHMAQGLDPIVLLVAVVLMGIVLFNAIQLRDLPRYIAVFRANFRDIAYVNAITLVSWTTSFAALRYIEPVLSNSASAGIEPLATLGLTLLLRRQVAVILKSDVIASSAMLVTALVQFAVIWTGLSGMQLANRDTVWIGIACVVANGLANAALTVVPKRLFDGGMTRSQILASRMFLLVIGGLIYIAVVQPPIAPLTDDWFGVAATFVGLMGTLYLVQAAIQYAEPVTVALICALNPIASLALQWFDPRLAFSPATMATTVVMVALVGWSTLEQLRSKK
jgi:drug/metabolite transporter (DMT)-like permease